MALRGSTSTRRGYKPTNPNPPMGYEIPTVEKKVEKPKKEKKSLFGKNKK